MDEEAGEEAGGHERRREAPPELAAPQHEEGREGEGQGAEGDGVEQGVLLLVAVASFQPEHSKEIPFARGEAVRVRSFDPAPEGWWYAEHRGRVGLVPQTFFRQPEVSSFRTRRQIGKA